MKKWLPYLIFAGVLIFAESCSKGVLTPDAQLNGNDITGSWVLTETADNNGSGWNYYKTGLERGVFTFYANGSAQFDDRYNPLTGVWDIITLSAGYYDQFGNYHNDLHQTFRVHVEDRYGNNCIDLYFDDISITNSSIIGTSYNGHTVTRYIFSRY